jgi:flagellar protein FlaG
MSITSINNSYGTVRELGSYRAKTPATDVQAEPSKPASETPQPNVKEMQQAVDNLNRVIAASLQSIHFTMDDESGKIVVKVLDSETQKVLRQVPNVEVLAISKNLARLQGLVISDKA